MFYTYMHTRNDTGQVFYIGKGSKRRPKDKFNRNRHWHFIVNKAGYTVHVLGTWKTEEDALIHEKTLIKTFKEMGSELANYVDGGKGASGLKHTEEAKKKMSAARMGNKFNVGYKHTSEAKKNMRKAQIGRKHSPETIAKMKAAQTGENNAMWGKENTAKRRAVTCVTTGITYPSIMQAAHATGADTGKITLVCQGKRNTTKGLVFKYG